MATPGSKKAPSAGSLNLGLSSLLERELQSAPPPVEEIPTPASNTNLNELERLFQVGEFSQLSALCEERLKNSDNQDVEARLWWLGAELRKGVVPISILYSPLEAVVSGLRKDGAGTSTPHCKIAGRLLREFAARLHEGGSPELALSALEHLQALDGSALAELKSLAGRELQRLKSETAFGDALVELNSYRERLQKYADAAGTDTLIPTANPVSGAEISYRSILVVIFFIVLVLIYRQELLDAYSDLKDQLFPKPITALVTSGAGAGTVAAQLPPYERVTALTNLDELIYNIKEKESEKQAAQVGKQESAGATQTLETPVAEVPVSVTAVPKIAAKPKEKVNTDSPLETAEVRRALKEGDADLPENRSVFDTDVLGQGIEIKPFPEQIPYRVIAKTYIYSRPSDKSAQINTMLRGDQVYVDAKYGPNWLRVRSRLGRAGFIDARDVVEAR